MTVESKCWVDSLPRVSRDNPSVIEVPAPARLEDMIKDVHALNTEARAVFMFHSEAVRGQLLSNPKARNALDQFLWELAKDEELGSELCKRNPIRYEPLQSLQAQS